jgi:hypothetical protein
MATSLALAIALGLIGYSIQGWFFAMIFPLAFVGLVLPIMKFAIALEVKYSVRLEEESKLASFLGLHAGRIGALCLFGVLLFAMFWASPVR